MESTGIDTLLALLRATLSAAEAIKKRDARKPNRARILFLEKKLALKDAELDELRAALAMRTRHTAD